MKDFNFTLLQNSLRNNRNNTSNQTNNYDVINRSQNTLTKENALGHCQRRIMSRTIHALKFQTEKIHSKQLTPNPNKFPQLITSNSSAITANKQNTIQTINVITRNRPQIKHQQDPLSDDFAHQTFQKHKKLNPKQHNFTWRDHYTNKNKK